MREEIRRLSRQWRGIVQVRERENIRWKSMEKIQLLWSDWKIIKYLGGSADHESV